MNNTDVTFRLPLPKDFGNWFYRKYPKAQSTDFARLGGGMSYYVVNGKKPYAYDEIIVENIDSNSPTASLVAVRPCICFSNIDESVDEYKYGEYPQHKLNDDLAKNIMNELRKYGGIPCTGKQYHVYRDTKLWKTMDEFVYAGRKYAYCPSDKEDVLFTVDVIKWIRLPYAEKGIFIAEHSLLSGMAMPYASFFVEREFGDQITQSNAYNPSLRRFTNTVMQSNSTGNISHQGLSNNVKTPPMPMQDNPESIETFLDTQQKTITTITGEENISENDTDSYTLSKMVSIDTRPMTISEQIQFYVENGMSFMLHGPSGVGKTARVEQIDPDLTAVPLWNGVLPEDIVGKVRYPNGEEKPATENEITNGGIWVAPDWYVELSRKCAAEPKKMHVLFIDEVTNARPTTQSLIFHLTLKKSISPSQGKLPKNSVVVLAGNSKEESGAAYNMPEPLFRRMAAHIYLDANVREWLVWANEKDAACAKDTERLNIHPLVSSFVASYGKKVFYSSYDEEDAPNFAIDPRGWKQISDIIYNNKGIIRRELMSAKMGPELSSNFLAFAENPPLTIEEVVKGKYNSGNIPQTNDAKLALTLGLRHAQAKDIEKVRKFVQSNLGKEYAAVFDAARHSDAIANDNVAVKFVQGYVR